MPSYTSQDEELRRRNRDETNPLLGHAQATRETGDGKRETAANYSYNAFVFLGVVALIAMVAIAGAMSGGAIAPLAVAVGVLGFVGIASALGYGVKKIDTIKDEVKQPSRKEVREHERGRGKGIDGPSYSSGLNQPGMGMDNDDLLQDAADLNRDERDVSSRRRNIDREVDRRIDQLARVRNSDTEARAVDGPDRGLPS